MKQWLCIKTIQISMWLTDCGWVYDHLEKAEKQQKLYNYY